MKIFLNKSHYFRGVCFVAIPLLLLLSCGPTKLIKTSFPHETLEPETNKKESPIKLHMKDGDLYVLYEWTSFDTVVIGYGKHYNPRRRLMQNNFNSEASTTKAIGPGFTIPADKIAIGELSNMSKKGGNIAGITFIGGFGAIISFYCMINPKACFGSCPTFYTYDGEEEFLMAEGFSSSILPSFEKRDVDMLYWSKSPDKNIKITVTNEALETHIIRYANLYAFPLQEGQRVYGTEGEEFFLVDRHLEPISCIAEEGDCLDKILEMDHEERLSLADSNDLLTKEYIDLEFVTRKGEETGLIIGSRQSLMTTYLFYQGLAYSGNYAGYFAARIESGDKKLKKRVEKIWEMLGQIEIFVEKHKGKWDRVGAVEEMGPIAADVHLVKLPELTNDTTRIRVKMTKGLWRIDYLALAVLKEKVEPCQITPFQVTNDGFNNPQTLDLLLDTLKPLITYPGNRYELFYELPDKDQEYELFLETKGYYLEWIRDEWREEEDLTKARRMFGFPRKFMKEVAGDFKALEPAMEDHFWNSRYVKENK